MLRKLRKHWACKALAWVTTVVMVSFAVIPAEALTMPRLRSIPVNWDRGLPAGWTQFAPKVQSANCKLQSAKCRTLSGKEMVSIRGRGPYRNKYRSGVLPWQRQIRDVNLCTGNLFKSFTDIQVAPARGAGLVLQRTYNSNDERFGPFGVGWMHAYDIRMQEESSAPVTDETLNLADRADFFGGQHKYHRDADGLYTPPPYLYDELSSEYDSALVNGPMKVLTDQEVSMDGTVKHYIAGQSGATVVNPERVCDYIKDRYGNQTNLTYTDVAWPDGSTKKLLSTVTDPSNRTLTFTWTNLGTQGQPAYRITAVQGPVYSVNYAYNADVNLSSVTLDPSGLNRTTTYGYTSYTGANGTEFGLLASVTDPLNHTVNYSYSYPSSNPTQTVWVTGITEPGSGGNRTWTITVSITSGDVPIAVTASSNGGAGVGLAIDGYLRKRFCGMGYAYMWQTDYQSDTNNVIFERAGGSVWLTNGYISTTDTVQHWRTFGQHGNVLTDSLFSSGTPATSYTYYNASQYFQKASVTDTLGRTTSFGVGANNDANPGNRGSVLWVRDAGYNVVGSPSYHKEFDYQYNSYGQKTSETNMNGVVTNYTYGDAWGNLTQVVQDPGTGHLNRTTSMVYDSGGRVTQSTDPSGYTSTFSYNSLGQPTQAVFPATQNTPSETVNYTYGSNGRLSTVADNRGTTSLAYETGNDRVSSVTDPVTGAVSYTYGMGGERATMSLPGGGTWTYDYNGLSILPKDDPNSATKGLSRITDDQGRIADYTLDQQGKLYEASTNQTFNMGSVQSWIYTRYYYDSTHCWLNQITNQWKTLPNNSTTLTQNIYTYNEAGMRLTNAIYNSAGLVRTELYGYDDLYRLTSVDYGDSQTQSYSFDSMGNRLAKNDSTNGNESYTYSNANMLLTRGSNNYTNDLSGNTLTGGGRTNIWDSQNRLAQCTFNGTTSNFTYAADGMRHRSVVGANTTDYVLDGPMFVRDKLNGLINASYLVGPRGPEYRRDTTGTIRWYVYDGLGCVLGECDPSGTLTATRSYDVYGAVRTSAGASTSKHRYVGNLGHPSEEEDGLIYMRARYMDPTSGRFVSEDPSKHRANWFVYASQNPVCRIDRSGRDESIVEVIVSVDGAITIDGVVGLGELDAVLVGQVGTEVMVEVNYIAAASRGFIGFRTMYSAIKVWAAGNGITALWVQGVAGSKAGEALMQAFVKFIEKMGDSGRLITNDPYTMIYWLLQ